MLSLTWPPESTKASFSMSHANLSNPGTKPCWHCHWFDGMTAQDTAALCSNKTCPRVRSQPENGCCSWEREPGSDDESGPPFRGPTFGGINSGVPKRA